MSEKLRQLLGEHTNAYPKKLSENYSRIVEKIINLWGTKEMSDYFDQLLIAERDTSNGERAGFPDDVASEIFKLMMAYDDIIKDKKK